MLERFNNILDTKFNFLKNKKLLIACSGGLDSVVLAHLCSKLQLQITLAHCNFKLRAIESDEDAQFVQDLSKKLGVKALVKEFNVKAFKEEGNYSTQMAARTLRYNWFNELLDSGKFDFVVTAHHADDALETFLINLSRGTGLDGLTGIPEINNKTVRPLLQFSREEIYLYAVENKLKWREDSSNASTIYVRNKLRLEAIPVLKETHPEFLNNFLKTQHFLQQTQLLVKEHINTVKHKLFIKDNNIIKILITHLQKLHPLTTYLYYLFSEYGFTQWNDIQTLINSAQSGKYVSSDTHRLIKDRTYLLLTTLPNAQETVYTIKEPKEFKTEAFTLLFTEVTQVTDKSNYVFYADASKLKFPLTVRKPQEGDWFLPFGMKGKKKLSKFFKDEKLSLVEKENQWLLCSENDIVWVIGRRGDDRFKASDSSKKIIKITVEF